MLGVIGEISYIWWFIVVICMGRCILVYVCVVFIRGCIHMRLCYYIRRRGRTWM